MTAVITFLISYYIIETQWQCINNGISNNQSQTKLISNDNTQYTNMGYNSAYYQNYDIDLNKDSDVYFEGSFLFAHHFLFLFVCVNWFFVSFFVLKYSHRITKQTNKQTKNRN